MIDWHNHLLPEMDDGSHSVAESITMLQAQASQGVTLVVATPHFYPNDESVASFLERRAHSYDKLMEQWSESMPAIRLGAEVQYYPGISRMDELKSLRIQDSKLLLLEMPMSRWTETVIRELIDLSGKNGICLMLAHIDRYLHLQTAGVWERLLDHGILMQTNASFFNSRLTRRKALTLLGRGYVHFLGSDCHNMTTRPPQVGKAYDVIRKKFDDDYVYQMTEYGYSLLQTIKT